MSSEDTKKCPFCAETIRAEARVCRFCGRDLTGKQSTPAVVFAQQPAKRGCIGTAFRVAAVVLCVLVVFIVIAAVVSNGNSSVRSPSGPPTPVLTLADIKQKATEITYRDLARNVESHTDKIVHYTGEIIQAVDDGDENFQLRVSVDSNDKDANGNIVWLNYTGRRVLESDRIDFYATVDGMRQYETIFGAAVSIPELTSLSLKVVD